MQWTRCMQSIGTEQELPPLPPEMCTGGAAHPYTVPDNESQCWPPTISVQPHIYIYVYMSAPYASRCYSCASLMGAPCTEWHIPLQPRSTLFSGFLRSVAILLQAVCSQSICFRRSRRAPSPTPLCAGAMHSSRLFSVCIIRRFTLRALHLHKCWITLSWCTKYLRTISHYHC